MSLNRVISNWVWKVMLLCFGFALLRNMIGVELKLTPYFKSARLKTKSNRDLGLLPLTFLWFWFYNTQLKCPLKDDLVHWAYLKNRINIKLLNCPSSRFWINIVLSSLHFSCSLHGFPFFPFMTDTPSSACSNTSLLLQLLGYLRKSTCRFSFHLSWRLIIYQLSRRLYHSWRQ